MSLQEYEAYKKACDSYSICDRIVSRFFKQKLILKASKYFYGYYSDWEVTFRSRKAYLQWYELMGKYSYLHELKAKGFRYELIIT